MHAQASQSDILTERARRSLAEAIAQVNGLVLGKPREIRLAFATLLAGGHLLVEDLPGLGKTTLARSMAASLGLQFQRMQFTSDLLPSDIIGVSIFDAGSREFRFHPGPVFTQMLLADEINRAPPRTQSALLEAMAERQVTVDGVARTLPHPFFVMATQNPVDLAGTFPLPDSQLDRFMLRISLGYPDATAEKAMLAGDDRRSLVESSPVRLAGDELLALQGAAARIHASQKLVDYVHALLAQSRRHPGVRVGLSPRAGLALLAGARALALLHGRDHVLPEDVQAIFVEVAAHRLVPEAEANTREKLAKGILLAVAVD
jgi:MoxR-like ATPase